MKFSASSFVPLSFPKVGSEKLTFRCGHPCGSRQTSFRMTVFYPVDEAGALDKSQGPFPLVSFLHGALARGEYYRWVGETLASKGYIVLLPSRNKQWSVSLDEGLELIASSVEYMLERNDTRNDPFQHAIDSQKIGIGGHSLGGFTAITLASQAKLDFEIGAVVALTPGNLESVPRILAWVDRMNSVQVPRLGLGPGIYALRNLKVHLYQHSRRFLSSAARPRAPTMIQAGSLDAICRPSGVRKVYSNSTVTKCYVEIAGANHVQFMDTGRPLANSVAAHLDNKPAISRTQQLSISSKYMSAWFDYVLEGDPNAGGMLEEGSKDVPANLSQYELVIHPLEAVGGRESLV